MACPSSRGDRFSQILSLFFFTVNLGLRNGLGIDPVKSRIHDFGFAHASDFSANLSEC